MIRTRTELQANYKSVFCNGKTIRMPIDNSKPITELKWPEFVDLCLNSRCRTGQTLLKQQDGSKQNCYYCYASASLNGEYFKNVVEKVKWLFEQMTLNQRVLQVAIGGGGEPLEHEDFWKVCETLVDLQIVPNFTTNGMLVTDETVSRTKELGNACAITLHEHMEPFWRRALKKFVKSGAKLNVHNIISDTASILKFEQQYKELKDDVDYFVLLPYMNVGHAAKHPKKIDFETLERVVDKIYLEGKLAFGANFYNWLGKNNHKFNLNLYLPEIFSKYVVLDQDVPQFYNNSFEMKPVPFNHKDGCELGHSRNDFNFDNFITV